MNVDLFSESSSLNLARHLKSLPRPRLRRLDCTSCLRCSFAAKLYNTWCTSCTHKAPRNGSFYSETSIQDQKEEKHTHVAHSAQFDCRIASEA